MQRPIPAQALMADLSGRRAAFVREYLIDLNATAAYIRAGYKDSPAANKHAHRLLKDPQVQAAIAAMEAKATEAALTTIQELEQQLERIAHFDIRTVFNADGTVKLPTEWGDDAGAAVECLTVEERVTEADGRKVEVRVKHIRMRDPVTPLIVLIRRRDLAGNAATQCNGRPERMRLIDRTEPDEATVQRALADIRAALGGSTWRRRGRGGRLRRHLSRLRHWPTSCRTGILGPATPTCTRGGTHSFHSSWPAGSTRS
jgi:phage terminase small subunit